MNYKQLLLTTMLMAVLLSGSVWAYPTTYSPRMPAPPSVMPDILVPNRQTHYPIHPPTHVFPAAPQSPPCPPGIEPVLLPQGRSWRWFPCQPAEMNPSRPNVLPHLRHPRFTVVRGGPSWPR